MIYRSNLQCPDLQGHFKHLTARPMPHSFGHTVLSDWADKDATDPEFGLYKNCGLWTHDEAAILYNVASRGPMQAMWGDIGSHTGWTSKHINYATNGLVECVDPMLRLPEWCIRHFENTGFPAAWVLGLTSNEYFRLPYAPVYNGFCIDGDHEPGKPTEDAMNAAAHLADNGVLIFHDFVGRPVRDAVQWCMNQGMKCRIYTTPHMVALCWKGDFEPPFHVPDPHLMGQSLESRMPDFNFGRCV